MSISYTQSDFVVYSDFLHSHRYYSHCQTARPVRFCPMPRLDHGEYLPERDPKQLETVLASATESTYGRDGTERPRQRPRNPGKQKH